jgi:hypothetical protein
MLTLIRVSGVVAALAIAVPALAQQSATVSHKATKHAGKVSKSSPAEVGAQGGYMSTCGAHKFRLIAPTTPGRIRTLRSTSACACETAARRMAFRGPLKLRPPAVHHGWAAGSEFAPRTSD